MYNYFESKEALLRAIIHRSVNEIYQYLDVNRDGYLTQTEFEFFLRKIDNLLKRKKPFWRLLGQLLLQKDVKGQLLKAFPESDSLVHPGHEPGDNLYPSHIMEMLTQYFQEKKRKEGSQDNDPSGELELFRTILLGYSIKTIYSDEGGTVNGGGELDRIIELFK
jgi:AcrR family transcriptional regulator